MKKILSISIAVALVALSTIPAFAHGSHHGRQRNVSYYGDVYKNRTYCELEDCTVAGYHWHDGVYSFGHTYNDGHDYHSYCDVADCTLTAYHEHDGIYCFGHTANDGHSYHHKGSMHH